MEPSSGWSGPQRAGSRHLGRKMSLLVRYGAIDKLEPALFYGTLEALR